MAGAQPGGGNIIGAPGASLNPTQNPSDNSSKLQISHQMNNETDVRWSKKMLKIYKAMTYLEKGKHMEPMMSKAFRDLAKVLYHDLRDGNLSLEKSIEQSSSGFLDGLSLMS